MESGLGVWSPQLEYFEIMDCKSCLIGDVNAANSVRLSTADGANSSRGKAREIQTLLGELHQVISVERLVHVCTNSQLKEVKITDL